MSKGVILVALRGYAAYDAQVAKRLEALGYEVNINTTGKPPSRETLMEYVRKSIGIIVGVDELDGKLLKECRSLKAVVGLGVGTDNIGLKIVEARKTKVGCYIGSNSDTVAELTIDVMLAAAKRLVSSNMQICEGVWDKPTGCELTKKNIGVIDFGNIGCHVTRIAHGAGMEVLVYDVFDTPKGVLDIYQAKQCSIEEILKSADFISIRTPFIGETRNMISDEQFDMVKGTAVIVNTARGGIINEKALYTTLKNKGVYAAVNDVSASEPPAQDGWVQELIHVDNSILTPHTGSRTVGAESSIVEMATDNLIRLLEEAYG